MERIKVLSIEFERSRLRVDTDISAEGIYIQNNGSRVYPAFRADSDGCFSTWFDMVTGGEDAQPLKKGEWRLICDGAELEFDDGISAFADYSDVHDKMTVTVNDDQIIVDREHLHSQPIAKRLVFAVMRAVFMFANLLKKSGKRVLFTSESRKSLSGNMKLVYDQMVCEGTDKKYDIKLMLAGEKSPIQKALLYIRLPFALGRSDFILIDDYHPMVYKFKYKKSVEVVQLWHACGAFKTMGYSRAGKKGAPYICGDTHKVYTKAIVSGEKVRRYYSEAFGIPLDHVFATGIPRTDMFFNKDCEEMAKDSFFKRFPKLKGKRIILFAPTFRESEDGSAYYPVEKIDLMAFEGFCRRTNSAVVFKMHPFVKDKIVLPNDDFFADAADYREINDILFAADILITDYSSVIYEFSLLSRPMLFFTFDLDDYTRGRDFYQPYEEFVPGKCAPTFDELISALENEDFQIERTENFRKDNFEFCDGKSAERVVKLIFGK